MLKTSDLKPLQRKALLAALRSPTHALQRSRKTYISLGNAASDGAQPVEAFTPRLMNMLERDGLVAFDPPMWPSRVTLTPEGVRLAEELRAGTSAKAGAA